MLLLKHIITKVLEYKVDLKGRIKFVCIAMFSLVMSLDLHVMSLNNNYYNILITVVQLTQRLVFGWHNINLLKLRILSHTPGFSDPYINMYPSITSPISQSH